MTVIYTDKFASRGGFGSFWKLLLRWRGSVYKMVWQDMLAYIVFYYILSIVYRFALPEESRRDFENFVIHCARFRALIPVSFVLGFFVSLVVNRWWGTYQSIPWPDTLAILLATHVQGKDNAAREIRGTILRYVNLAIVTTFASVSPVVKKEFPTPKHFVNAGFMTTEEMDILNELDKRNGQHKTWVPVLWAVKLVDRAREEGRLRTDMAQKVLTDEILKLRGCCGGLMGWNTYNIPLVYTQVVTIAVYSFFLFSVIGEQFLDPAREFEGRTNIDLYFPFFPFLQLFFYIGWLKVAEALLNPFGADDHDFEFLPMINRHVEMSRLLSEPRKNDLPQLVQSSGTPATTPATPTLPDEDDDDDDKPDYILVKPEVPLETLGSTVTYVPDKKGELMNEV